MGETTPDLVGVAGEATSAAAFAARWGERTRVSVVPAEAQRIYRLDELHPPSMVSGSFRQATNADRDTLIAYRIAFENDVGQPGDSDPASAVDESLVGGRAFVWCDPEPVATVGISRPTAGVARLGPVYTPLSLRRRGYGSACVAAASQWVRDNDDAECILYTQLSNPTSNAIYRALGYEPAGDVLMYRFGTPAAFR
ncbi:MAG: GNAT family N-acetyltransferase [Acidimicrobiia bacterium]